ncbi:MAG: pyruvate, phosphate dikinase [Polyangiales bacterium]
MTRHVYSFGGKTTADDVPNAKELLGGKGQGLREMARMGIPVPAGFIITTEVCAHHVSHGGTLPEGCEAQVREAMREIEDAMGARFGDGTNPLLVSVRSGARVSMPGMMDTVLNLGLNDTTVEALAKASGNARFAWDSYRRFVQMYGDVVLGLKPESKTEHDPFEVILDAKKRSRAVKLDTELDEKALRELVAEFKTAIRERLGVDFPTDPWKQLWGAVGAVFGSWENPRAVTYRKLNNIPGHWGTAVTVQAMVFGNLGDDCATGVAFTRDPSTGEGRFFGEFLVNAQGEDVVAGIRTPQSITKSAYASGAPTSLEELMPSAYADLVAVYQRLEKRFRDMQDIEFTIQRGKLWMLQTRNGKRTAKAMVRIAVEMVKEGLITRDEAVLRMDPARLDDLLHPTLDPNAPRKVLAKGLPASPGAATGKVVFHADEAEEMAAKGEKVILVRLETSPEDIHGMNAAEGILTARGGMTSHAAVVARGMGKCCVAGCSDIDVSYGKGEMTARTKEGLVTLRKGDILTLDGSKGEVILGAVPRTAPALDENFRAMMAWVDETRRLGVRTNADTPHDAETARSYGAEGIGLCRTEHMFFDEAKILAVREMILADTEADRRKALAKILPMQRQDFVGIFKAMDGLPVTVRLLDPPLHEFLPTEAAQVAIVAASLGVTPDAVKARVTALHEANPMLGHRGCRLGITHPEIYETQTRAIMEAAVVCHREGVKVRPEIMIPLVGMASELERLRELCDKTAKEILAAANVTIPYTLGTMIELPRACVVADAIAHHADFFSFGTNDLTQTTLGLSRDDAGRFLGRYVELGIFARDPFVTLDRDGVGSLIRMAVAKGRSIKPKLKVGICGEHGGDPASVAFCHEEGFDYVSCSPYRVPIARLAAAQAALRSKAAT